jgi:hypothetical protein
MNTTGYATQINTGLEIIRRAVGEAMADPDVGNQGLLDVAAAVDQAERTGHGLLLRVLARADQVKAARGGIGPWLSAELGYQPGRGRTIAQDARRIGAMPDLVQKLTSGQLGRDTTRILSRTVRAVTGTQQDPAKAVADTLAIVQADGITQAGEHVRALEHTVDPGRAQDLRARQRARSFARISELDEGMCRFDLLLDAERATVVRTALDTQVSTFLRTRQFDHTEQVAEDVATTEQLTAEAFTRLAEVYLAATDEQRANRYTPTLVYYAPAPSSLQESTSGPEPITTPLIPAGCVQTAYGMIIPAPAPFPRQKSTAIHLITDPDGQPTSIDGHRIDQDPTARLASPTQRLALAFRDRHCTHPGCRRPATWSLHAHHITPYSKGGPTTLPNMTLLCPEHHALAHSVTRN